ncbi:MAG: hypothetical protein ABIQ30_13795, partial [Devosia sp.]
MFRSFFPTPKLFFASAAVWMLITTLIFQLVGDPVRSVISIDRFLAPAICAPADVPAAQPGDAANPNAPAPTESSAPGAAATDTAAPAAAPVATQANCVAEDTNFLNGARIWE